MAQGFSRRFACERPQDRSSPEPKTFSFFFFFFLLLLFSGVAIVFSNHPFIGIDSDTFFFFFLELFKEASECGFNNNNNIEENGKDCQRVFDTDSSALCPH